MMRLTGAKSGGRLHVVIQKGVCYYSPMLMGFKYFGTLALALILASQTGLAGDMTAFQLIKEGNRYVGDDVKDQVVEVRSERSVGSLVPNIWYVVYYDPDATFHATEVKFAAGKKLDVRRPARMLEFGTKDSNRLNPKKLNVDSDKALSISTNEPVMKGLTLRASQLWLQHGDEGPVWKVRLWAAKIRNPNDMADIGNIYIDAADGTIVRRDVHIDRVD
jgi:hypothetical protein